jgi:hypothetical protein
MLGCPNLEEEDEMKDGDRARSPSSVGLHAFTYHYNSFQIGSRLSNGISVQVEADVTTENA